MAHTGAAGVMIGRAAQGRPWLCGQIAAFLATGVCPAAPSTARQLEILHQHVLALHRFYGEFMGVRIARKHLGWYLHSSAQDTGNKRLFNALEQASEQLLFIDKLYKIATTEVRAA